MTITFYHASNDEDYRDRLRIVFEDQDHNYREELRFCDGEPEDNTLSRNFSDIYKLLGFLKICGFSVVEIQEPWYSEDTC